MPTRMSAFEKYQQERRAEINETIDGYEDLIKLMLTEIRRPKAERVINPTQKLFLEDPSPVKVYMGPGGSGKTMIGVADIILKALSISGSKWFIARRDYNDLTETTMRKASEMMTRLPDGIILDKRKAPPAQWWLKPIATADNPMPEPSTITFLGLSDWIGSYEYCGGFIDELDEVEDKYFWQLKSRIRFIPYSHPTMSLFPITGSFNPPDKNHWLYKNCMGVEMDGTPYKNGKPTISLHTPNYLENAPNLRKGYYEEMDDMPAELIQRYKKGEWIDIYPGDPVVKQFNETMHVSADVAFKNHTLYRAWDFGYNRPAQLDCQLNTDGRLEIMDEFLGKQIEGSKFAETVLMRTGANYQDALDVQDYGDPAVDQHKDTGKMTTVLAEVGINMQFKRVPFDVSLSILRQRFEKLINGQPAIRVHPRCKVLIAGLKGGYRLKDDGVTPHKDGYYDHLIDALRYLVFYLYGSGLVKLATMSEAAKYTNSRAVWQKIRY